jgi:hypothetical protein
MTAAEHGDRRERGAAQRAEGVLFAAVALLVASCGATSPSRDRIADEPRLSGATSRAATTDVLQGTGQLKARVDCGQVQWLPDQPLGHMPSRRARTYVAAFVRPYDGVLLNSPRSKARASPASTTRATR